MPKLPNAKPIEGEITPVTKGLKTPQFPSISRFIPENTRNLSAIILYPKLFIVSFISCLIILGIIFQAHMLMSNLNKMKQLSMQKAQINAELVYWKKVSQKYSGYRDVYLKIAALEYKLGYTTEAKQYIEKAFSIDPNTKDGKVLGDKIKNKS